VSLARLPARWLSARAALTLMGAARGTQIISKMERILGVPLRPKKK
jgi:hypothetical protein